MGKMDLYLNMQMPTLFKIMPINLELINVELKNIFGNNKIKYTKIHFIKPLDINLT